MSSSDVVNARVSSYLKKRRPYKFGIASAKYTSNVLEDDHSVIPEALTICEVADILLRRTTLLTMHEFSMVNLQCRSVVQHWLRQRIGRQLLNFHLGDLLTLQNLLLASGGAVIGSSVLKWISPGAEWKPNDINFLVPKDMTGGIHGFLLGKGYHSVSQVDVKFRYREVSYAHYIYECEDGLRVTMTETLDDNDILEHIWLEPTTLTMGIFTGTKFIIPYGDLLSQNSGLFGFGIPDRDVLTQAAERGYDVEQCTYDWNHRCGLNCPALKRRVIGGSGITVIPIEEEDPLYTGYCGDILQSESVWSLGRRCYNKYCERSAEPAYVEAPKRK